MTEKMEREGLRLATKDHRNQKIAYYSLVSRQMDARVSWQ